MTLTRLGTTEEWIKQQFRKATWLSIGIAIVFLALGFFAGLFACEILELIGDLDVAACSSCAEASPLVD